MPGLEVKRVSLPPIAKREVMRYAGVKEEYDGFSELYEKALALVADKIKNAVVFRIMDCRVDNDIVTLENHSFKSSALAKLLSDSDRVILAAATVGREIDILQAKYIRSAPSLSVVLGAVGAERIEAVMDSFENEISASLGNLTHRFSPGYGDLSIEFQRKMFSLLNPEKHIGLTLTDSLLMAPTKSVSAIIGIKKNS